MSQKSSDLSNVQLYINNIKFKVKSDISVLEASNFVGFNISRFCYHESLSIVGTCRICLVEIEKSLRPAASCALPVINNMRIHIDTPLVKKARESVIEALLINHPLDCPICDQAGECDLQDLTKIFGGVYSRSFESKRVVEDKECGVLIKTIMTRCIHCTRCVRFVTEVAGTSALGSFSRGMSTEIGGYIPINFRSELSGNVIDLCPVGALTSKSYAFKSRPWGMKIHESVDLSDSTGSNIYVHLKEVEILRVLPKRNHEINGNFISDKSRFSHDANTHSRIKNPTKHFDEDKMIWQIVTPRWQHCAYLIDDGDTRETRESDKMTWQRFLLDVDIMIKRKMQKILIVVNNDLDLEAINAAKKLTYRTKGLIEIKSLNSASVNESSFFESQPTNQISDLDNIKSRFCFLLSSNLRLESAILNGKLRAKHSEEDLNIYSLGYHFLTSLSAEFIAIGVSGLTYFFEGKSDSSKKFVSKKSPLLFVGESFRKRFDPVSSFIIMTKLIMPTLVLFLIVSSCNSSGASLMNVKSLNNRDVYKRDMIVFVNIDDTSSVRSTFKQKKTKIIYWLNTHNSQIVYQSHYTLPTKSLFESEGTFLNLENRPQKTFKTSHKISPKQGLRSISLVFKGILGNFAASSFLSYINEIVEKPSKFSYIGKKFCNLEPRKVAYLTTRVNNYPLLAAIEDFHTNGYFSKNSSTMLLCSKEARMEPKSY
jgi:NADH dehydrogenase/NADH:ubiquinone oxidoreductase subunit G